MTEPDSDALRIEEKLDRIAGEVAVSGDQIVGHLGRIEDLLLVLNDTMLRLEGREVGTTGLKSMRDRHERARALLKRRMTELEGPRKE